MSIVALVLALPLLALALVSLKSQAAMFVIDTALESPRLWLSGAALLFAITVVAGIYPAVVLSRVHALQAVRAGRATTDIGWQPCLSRLNLQPQVSCSSVSS